MNFAHGQAREILSTNKIAESNDPNRIVYFLLVDFGIRNVLSDNPFSMQINDNIVSYKIINHLLDFSEK